MGPTGDDASFGEAVADAGASAIDFVTAPTPIPTIGWLLAACVVGLALIIVVPGPSRRLVTVTHEGGHALAAVLTRRHVVRVRIHADGSGDTRHLGRPGSLGSRITSFAGYPFPGVVGAALLAAAASGSARLWTAIAAAALLAMLLRTGNLHGWLAVGGSCAALLLALWYLPVAPLALLLAGVGALLLGGAIRSLLDERRLRRIGDRSSDVAKLAAGGRLPAAVWWGAMMAVILGSAWLSWEFLSVRVPGM